MVYTVLPFSYVNQQAPAVLVQAVSADDPPGSIQTALGNVVILNQVASGDPWKGRKVRVLGN